MRVGSVMQFTGLKEPKRDNFHLMFFTAINHVWAGDLGAVQKVFIFYFEADIRHFVIYAHAECAHKNFFACSACV
jgi:hypothetical protein